jgi:predicted permease
VLGALSGFAVVGFAILLGYIVGRTKLLGENGRFVLSKLAFYVCSPMLLFTILGTTDVGTLFSNLLPISVIAAALVFILFIVFALVRRQSFGTAVIGALGAGYVNANNIGIPIATFMLGGAAYAAPVILLQLIFWAPLALLSLDAWKSKSFKVHKTIFRTFKNPVISGSLAGLLVTLFHIPLPKLVWDATGLVGHAAVPLLLISFGISLHGTKILQDKSNRVNVIGASTLKLVIMPVIAWALAVFVFRLEPHAVYAVTVLAALPTAHNVFNYATEYDSNPLLARDVIFISTFGAIPVLFAITLLLAH